MSTRNNHRMTGSRTPKLRKRKLPVIVGLIMVLLWVGVGAVLWSNGQWISLEAVVAFLVIAGFVVLFALISFAHYTFARPSAQEIAVNYGHQSAELSDEIMTLRD